MIVGVNFDVWTAEDIRKESVVHVTEKKTYENNAIVHNGLRDSRMGATKGHSCPTCGENVKKCNGHFGHIELQCPVYHISWVSNVIYWLRCICYTPSCRNTLIKNFDTHNVQKNRHLQHYSKNVHTKCPECEERQPKYSWNRDKGCIEVNKVLYSIEDVMIHLDKLDSEVLDRVDLAHPKGMILTVLPVPPPSVRPPIMQGNSVRGEDDLTYRLIQIMRANDKLEKTQKDNRPKHIITDAKESLQNAVTGYINHTKVGSSKRKTSKREYTSLQVRLQGKEGRVRGNMMGKRCDFTGRSVITGDDHLKMSEVGIPISVAEKLTIPVKVTAYNKEILQIQLTQEKSPIKFVIRPNGSRVDLSFVQRTGITLSVGWTVERILQDGDIVLFNRQPSLHKMSIMAHEAKILPYSTFRMNLSCTTPYNADFDGDEMNIHVPQTVEARAEAKTIMAVKHQIVSPQSNKPVMSVIQDTMVGAYLLSSDDVTFTKEEMMECVYTMPGWDCKFKTQDVYTGKDLISYTLPMVNWSKGDVVIKCGKLLSGRLTKRVLGRSDGSLVHVIYNDCGPDETILFINRLQRIVHKFISIRGFSVGIGDMISDVNVQHEIEKAFEDIQLNCDTESKINQRLNICRDTMGTMVQKPLTDENRLYTMVYSGSKGSSINISQIMAVVGQQNLCGDRIPETWTGRTLPHFKRGSNGPRERGFITHSYVEGLDPHEVWFHAIAGREGLIDTAIKTSQTGYIQRRFMKALENIVIHWDGSARNSDESVVQFKYGDDGFDAMRVENQHVDIWYKPTPEKYGDECESLMQDHIYLHELNKWRDNGSKDTAMFQLPIPVDRIINNARTLFSFPSRKVQKEEARQKLQSLIQEIDNDMLKILIRCKLSVHRVIHEYELTLDELENIIHKIKQEYVRIKAIAGESVGAIAAQSIGEPATQMTLNTFHFAGVSSMNVTLGVPRLEELINCTKSDRMKTPSTIIQTDDPDTAIKELKHITLETLVKRIKVTKTPDKKEVEWFHVFPDADYVPHKPERETLVIYLKEWYDVYAIKSVFDTTMVTCAYTDGPNAIFHLQLLNDSDIGVYYEQNIRKQSIRGVEGAEQTIKVKLPGAKKYHVETSLSDLNKIIQMEDIDFSSINTNDIHAVAKTYGIEAARGTLIREIRQILSYYGIYVNMRHITLAVDWMTWVGELTPLTRHGIRKIDTSPLKRSTFEEVVDVFNQAACSKETDMLNGISECIISGAPPKVGTNVVGTVVDNEIIEQFKQPYPVEKSLFMEIDETCNNPWLNNEEDPWKQDDPWTHDPTDVWAGLPTPGLPQTGFQPMGFQPMGFQPMVFQPMGFQPMGFQNPNPILPGMQMAAPVALPVAQSFAPVQINRPPSPAWRPTSPAYDPQRPPSPVYDPQRPTSPAYDPQRPTSPAYDPQRPTSPAYDPDQPPLSPMSPAYDMESPMSPAYDMESPMSPAYNPDPMTPPESPMPPCYDLEYDVPVYDPGDDVPRQNKKRRTYC